MTGSVLKPLGCGWTCCWNCTGEPCRGVVCCDEEIEVADCPDEIDGAADDVVRFRSMMRGSFSWAWRKNDRSKYNKALSLINITLNS